MPLVEVSQDTTLEEARAPLAFAALAAFARRHLMPAPGEEGRGFVITGKDEIPKRQRALFDVLARFGAHIENAQASLVGLHGNSLDGPRWLELLDALAARRLPGHDGERRLGRRALEGVSRGSLFRGHGQPQARRLRGLGGAPDRRAAREIGQGQAGRRRDRVGNRDSIPEVATADSRGAVRALLVCPL